MRARLTMLLLTLLLAGPAAMLPRPARAALLAKAGIGWPAGTEAAAAADERADRTPTESSPNRPDEPKETKPHEPARPPPRRSTRAAPPRSRRGSASRGGAGPPQSRRPPGVRTIWRRGD
jgi:hypothetical protein